MVTSKDIATRRLGDHVVKRLVTAGRNLACAYDGCGQEIDVEKREAVTKHLKVHYGNMNRTTEVQCPWCNEEKYIQLRGLARHVRSAHIEYKHRCLLADQGCSWMKKRFDEYKAHFLQEHPTQLDVYLDACDEVDPEKERKNRNKTAHAPA